MIIKRLIKRIFLFLGYLFHRNNLSKVIFYHDVGLVYTDMGTPLGMIKKHIEVIVKQKFQIVEHITKPDNQIMICFDDGWKGIYDAKDFFIENKIFPTIFIAVDLIGSEGHLTTEQIIEMKNLGFTFEAHSWSHKDLTSFTQDELIHELVDSKRQLEDIVGEQMKALCFPEGRFSDQVLEVANKAGYKELYSSISGAYYERSRDGYICRNLVQDLSAQEVKYLIKGDSDFIANRYFKQHYQK